MMDSVGKSVRKIRYGRETLRKYLIINAKAGNENRTRIASLEGWSFTIKLCPHKSNGKQGCHEVAGSQAVFSARSRKAMAAESPATLANSADLCREEFKNSLVRICNLKTGS
jgi:hypothetical protein